MNFIGEKFLINDDIVNKEEFIDKYVCDSKNVYEVVRVINSKILFWEEHNKRFHTSIAKYLGWDIEVENLYEKVDMVIKQNSIINGNIKIEIVFDENCNLYIYPTLFYYPKQDESVKCQTFNIERRNPTIKMYDYTFRKKCQKVIDETGVYEVILINNKGFITEGSRTNIYFIKDNVFYTAPKELVLSGVTREKVNEIIKELGFELVEKCILKEDIEKFECCFLTSTSSNVLAIESIDNSVFNSSQNLLFQKVKSEFEKKLKF